MATSSGHYERALDAYLRATRAPYASVRAARRALLGEGVRLTARRRSAEAFATLKSFDFVLYGRDEHLLLEVKGRRLAQRSRAGGSGVGPGVGPEVGRRVGRDADPTAVDGIEPARARARPPRLDSWVTADDVESMTTWGDLFGPGYRPVFVFLYWCRDAADHAAFGERFEHDGRLYGVRAIDVGAYAASMVVRSPRWRTVHVPAAAFASLSRSLTAIVSPVSPETSGADAGGRASSVIPGLAAAEVRTRPVGPAAGRPQPAAIR